MREGKTIFDLYDINIFNELIIRYFKYNVVEELFKKIILHKYMLIKKPPERLAGSIFIFCISIINHSPHRILDPIIDQNLIIIFAQSNIKMAFCNNLRRCNGLWCRYTKSC